MSSPYELMWNTLARRLGQGKTGWGKHELLAQMKEIEIGVWRQTNYLVPLLEDEATADEQLADYLDMILWSDKSPVPLDLVDLDEMEFMLNEAEETQVGLE